MDWSFGECAEGFAVLKTNANRVVMTDMGFVHVTSDGGAHWHQAYVNPLDENPEGAATPKGKAYRTAGVEQTSGWWLTWADANTIFVTTETDGLWSMSNLTAASPTFVADPDYPFAHPMRVFFNPNNAAEVWIASFGGGLRVRTF